MEAGGNWDGEPRWPRKTEGGETGGTLAHTEGLWAGTGWDPWTDTGPDTPERQRHPSDTHCQFFQTDWLAAPQTLEFQDRNTARYGKHAKDVFYLTLWRPQPPEAKGSRVVLSQCRFLPSFSQI